MSRKRRLMLSCEGQMLLLALLATCFTGICDGVDVKFSSPDHGGFFIKNQEDDQGQALGQVVFPGKAEHEGGAGGVSEGGGGGVSEVKYTKFTLLDSKQPITVRASYGPFTSQETVYPNLNQEKQDDDISNLYQPAHIDFTAHLVNAEVRKENPVLRVVFSGKQRQRKPLCVVLHAAAEYNATEVQSYTTPKGDTDNFLGELVIPSSWWPPLNSKVGKQPKQLISISYSIQAQCGKNQVSVLGKQNIGVVPLTTGQAGYRQIAGDEVLHLLIPQSPTYPGSSIYVPVFVEQPTRGLVTPTGGGSRHFIESADKGARLTVLVVRANARKGARIVNVEGSSKNWDIRVDLNPRGSVATVTAFRKDSLNATLNSGPEEVFNFLYQVDKADHQVWKGCKLSWHVKYQVQDQDLKTSHVRGPRLRHKLHVNKDDVQSVLPISKSRELVNTAVLTGRQVSDPLKILMVSQAGDIADVTLHTSCTTNDDSALKVSSSCTSVYLDGSETRGAISAQIQAKYGTYSGSSDLRVWMPEIPVNLVIPDSDLAILDGWRVPDRTFAKRSAANTEKTAAVVMKEEMDLWEGEWREVEGSGDRDIFMIGEDILPLQFNNPVEQSTKETDKKKRGGCNNRFQQTKVNVFTRFAAEDPDSGRRDYFISRSVQVDLTDITTKSIRVQDSRIAYLEGNILRGVSVGRTEVQVISPVTGRVIGSSEVKVSRTKETVKDIHVKLVTGINLAVSMDSENGVYTPVAEIGDQLTSKYQEGILDIELEFSDGHRTSLSDVDSDEYYLSVDSLNPEIIAFAPAAGATHPRVIAVGEGEGDLLTVSLDVVEKCDRKVLGPLATTTISLSVHTSGEHPSNSWPGKKKDKKKKKKLGTNTTNNKPSGTGIKSVDMGDISEVLSNIALRDDNSHNVIKKHYSPDIQDPIYVHSHEEATTLEVGMYILLGVFCIAISVFMASCFVYASKHHQPHAGFPLQERSRSVQNAHDWVWLGRQTLDKSSVCTSTSKDVIDASLRSRSSSAYTGRVIGYPGGRMNYSSRQINIIPNPCIDFSNAQRNNRQAGMVYNPIQELPEQSLGNLHENLVPEFPSTVSADQLSHQQYQRSSPTSSHHTVLSVAHAGVPITPTDMAAANPAAELMNGGDVYAELPRRRGGGGSGRKDWRGDRGGGMNSPRAGKRHVAGEKSHYHQSSQPFQYHEEHSREDILKERKLGKQLLDHGNQLLEQRRSCSDDSSSCNSSKPSINSATYTRNKAVDPLKGDILPVGFPVFSSLGHETEDEYGEVNIRGDGFQNPWEALHSALQGSKTENSLLIQKGADLSLDLGPAFSNSPYQLFNRQSPASGLPPDTWEDNTDSGKGSLSRGEYTPLNPDINKATPPRYGSLKRVKDPFKVSEKESPTIPLQHLNPQTHVFSKDMGLISQRSNLTSVSERIVDSAVDNFSDDLSELSRDEDDEGETSSVCSINSSELGPPTQHTLPPSSPLSSGKMRQPVSVSALSSPTYSHVAQPAASIDQIELGALDYEQLMNYFEDLRESAA